MYKLLKKEYEIDDVTARIDNWIGKNPIFFERYKFFMRLKIVIFLSFFLSLCQLTFANNILVSDTAIFQDNNDLNNHRMKIKFHLEWENSWRDTDSLVSAATGNYDAAWVFIKFSIDGGVTWHHARLYSSGNPVVNTLDGYSFGTGTGVEIKVPTDNQAGAFVQRSAPGTGKLSVDDLTLVWNYGVNQYSPDPSTTPPTPPITVSDAQANMAIIKVMAIEMVYIPSGAFWVGSGLTSTNSSSADTTSSEYKSFFKCSDTTSPAAYKYQITNEDPICLGGSTPTSVCPRSSGGLTNPAICWASSTVGTTSSFLKPISKSFPKGFQAFYVMKYEISQGQFRDFLNLLTRSQQDVHDATTTNAKFSYYAMTNTASSVNRNYLRFSSNVTAGEPITIGCDQNNNNTFDEPNDGEWVAANFLQWHDLTAYAEWSGLRPLTELEFEKAARGVENTVKGEFAWGQYGPDSSPFQYITNTPGISRLGYNDETDSNTNSIGSSVGIANYGQTAGILGPMRVGYAAAITPSQIGSAGYSRAHSGASYYGVMELSGNLGEMVVPVADDNSATKSSLDFDGSHGSGELTADGYAYEPNWPGKSTSSGSLNKVNTEYDTGMRGGSWYSVLGNKQALRVSSRLDVLSNTSGTRATSYDQGGRLARTAP